VHVLNISTRVLFYSFGYGSPTLASAEPVESTILMVEGKPYPLRKGFTTLQDWDYAFLQRFLDSEKANLFFARSVVMGESPAEAILLLTLTIAAGCLLIADAFSSKGPFARKRFRLPARMLALVRLALQVIYLELHILGIPANCSARFSLRTEVHTVAASWPKRTMRH